MSDNDFPIRAYVARDFRRFGGCSIWLVHRQRGLLRPGVNDGLVNDSWEPLDETTDRPPSLMLDDEMARVLLDALAAYFGGTGDVQALRRDYDAERKRVDKMIDALIVAGGQAVRP